MFYGLYPGENGIDIYRIKREKKPLKGYRDIKTVKRRKKTWISTTTTWDQATKQVIRDRENFGGFDTNEAMLAYRRKERLAGRKVTAWDCTYGQD